MGAGEAPGGLRAWLDGLKLPTDSTVGPSRNWRFDYLFSIGSRSWFIHLCITALTGVVLWRSGGGDWVLAWTAIMQGLTAGMIVLAFRYLKEQPSVPAPHYGAIHSVLTASIGIMWGVGALACANLGPDEMLSFYTLILGGTALGAVSSQHAFPRSALLSIWTSIPPLALAWGSGGWTSAPLASATMMLLYGVALSMLAVRMGKFVEQNVELAKALAAQNAALLQASEQLQQTHEDKSRFLAQASHDLRQPIHAIGLFVDYLGGMRLSQDSRAVLGNIERSLDSLNRLCRSLLDVTALDVGRVKPNLGPLALADVMGEVVRQAQPAAEAARIRLRYRPSRIWVHGDPALLHTMVQNLVSNAVKYAPGADVLVGVRRRNGQISIVVADTGPGIDAADHGLAFREFVRLHRPGAAEAEGLGLGLSIVKRLAELLGLQVTLASQLGDGAVFAIDGLVETAIVRPSLRRQPAKHTERLNGVRVLVIDDDRLVRVGTVQLLSRWGCAARATARVGETFEVPDVILCDYELGGSETGLEVIARIRERAGYRVPAAIITGTHVEDLARMCREAGVALMSKPVRPAQLRSVLLSGMSVQISPSSEAMPAAAERVETSSPRSSAET